MTVIANAQGVRLEYEHAAQEDPTVVEIGPGIFEGEILILSGLDNGERTATLIPWSGDEARGRELHGRSTRTWHGVSLGGRQGRNRPDPGDGRAPPLPPPQPPLPLPAGSRSTASRMSRWVGRGGPRE